MIISRTPFRISLFGGGTDYPTWFREHGGAVLGLAIENIATLRCDGCRPFSSIGRGSFIRRSNWLTPYPRSGIRPCGRSSLTKASTTASKSITTPICRRDRASDPAVHLPSGCARALCTRQQDDLQTRPRLRGDWYQQEVLKEQVGSQDQMWAAYGGFNRFEFFPDGTFAVSPMILPGERRHELNRSLMLFFTGFSRFATDFAQDQVRNIPNRKNQLTAIRSMVDSAVDILQDEKAPLRQLGELLHESWRLKRELADTVSIGKSTKCTMLRAMLARSVVSSWALAVADLWSFSWRKPRGKRCANG